MNRAQNYEEGAEEIRNSHNEGAFPPQSVPVGGRLCRFVEGWKCITNDPVKYRRQGVQTSFYKSTPSAQDPMGNTISPGPQKFHGMREQISLKFQKNVIMEVPPDSPGFYSNVFLVSKGPGGWRPVIDLKQLNAHIYAPHYCIHTISSVLSTVEKGDYVSKIDLQDVYFHVLIHPDSGKYLRFAFKNKVYQFRVLPFSLNTAPQVFTRLGHTVAAYLHHQGISVIPYLDDWLLHHLDHQALLCHQSQILKILDFGRPQVKQRKIQAGPRSEYPVSLTSVTPGSGESFTPRMQSCGDKSTCMPNIPTTISVIHTSVPVHGITQLGIRSYPTGLSAPEPITTTFSFFRSDKPFRPVSPCQPTRQWQDLSFLISAIPITSS